MAISVVDLLPSLPETDHGGASGGDEKSEEAPPASYPSDFPGSLAGTSKAVANMMRLWNYKEGSGLGAQGQGIIAPIQPATMLRPNAGIGRRKKPYDNGLADDGAPWTPRPPPVEEEHLVRTKAMELEEECCEKTLQLLREHRRRARKKGRGGDDVAAALAAVFKSKMVFKLGKRRKPGMWKRALPPSTSRFVIEGLVVPAITADLHSWIPSWDPDCYNWLRPWIPLIGHMPEHLYDAMENKLTDYLHDYPTISPWKKYLSPAQWSVFAARHILPKLTWLVGGLTVTPPKQRDTSFRAAMAWGALVPVSDVAEILEAELFFDRWERALRHWLRSAMPAREEAIAWCAGWRSLFTPELLADERVFARVDGWVGIVNSEAEKLDSRSLVSFRSHGASEGCTCWWCSSLTHCHPPIGIVLLDGYDV